MKRYELRVYVGNAEKGPKSSEPANATKNRPTLSVTKVVSRKPTTAIEKRKKIMPIITELLNLAADSCEMRLQCKMAILKEICERSKESGEDTINKSDSIKNNANHIETIDMNERPDNNHRQQKSQLQLVNNNLRRLIDKQCSVSAPSIVEPTGVSDANLKLPEITVPSDYFHISQEKVPPTIKIVFLDAPYAIWRQQLAFQSVRLSRKGSSKNSKSCGFGTCRTAFIDMIINEKSTIGKRDLRLENLKDSVVDDSVDLNNLAPYCEVGACAALTVTVTTKKKRSVFKCEDDRR